MQIIHAAQALTPTGWQKDVAVTLNGSGRIVSVGAILGAPDIRVDLLLAAPTNLHSHAFQRAMAGLTESRGPDPSDSFWTWRRLMYRFLGQLTPDHVEAIAAQVFLEMLEAGYGAVGEFHYLHHAIGGQPYDNLAEMSERIVAAAVETGIGLTLLPVLYQRAGCDGGELEGGQRRFGNDTARFGTLVEQARVAIDAGHADFHIGVAPHSLRAVDDTGLRAAIRLGAGGPVHMHIAEQQAEVDEVKYSLGARPVEWLLDNHPIDRRWCLIHATQMTESETRNLARTGAVAGLCPITEANLGDGIFNGESYFSSNGAVGFGSDSNVEITLFGELRMLEYSQRLVTRKRAVLARPNLSVGRTLMDLAAAGGAQATGRDSGQIAAGQWGDLIGLATDNCCVAGRHGDAALDSLIFADRGENHITDVWSAGRHMVSCGHHIRRDQIAARFRATLAELGQTI